MSRDAFCTQSGQVERDLAIAASASVTTRASSPALPDPIRSLHARMTPHGARGCPSFGAGGAEVDAGLGGEQCSGHALQESTFYDENTSMRTHSMGKTHSGHTLQEAIGKAASIQRSVAEWTQSKGALLADSDLHQDLARLSLLVSRLQASAAGGEHCVPAEPGVPSEPGSSPLAPPLHSLAHRSEPQMERREGEAYQWQPGPRHSSDSGCPPPPPPRDPLSPAPRALADTGKQELLEDFNRLAHLVQVLQHRSQALEHVMLS